MSLYPDTTGVEVANLLDLDSAYTEYIRSLPQDNRQGVFHPSAVGTCRRAAFYEFLSMPSTKTRDPKMGDIFELGHHIHDLVQTRIEGLLQRWCETEPGAKAWFRREVPYNDPVVKQHWLYDDLGIAGTTDFLLHLQSPRIEQSSVVEIKSIALDAFNSLKEPKKEHLMQAHLYGLRFNASSGYIWYFCKNNSKRKVYPYVFDPRIADEAVNWFSDALGRVRTMEEPPREESWFGCDGCSYANICQPEILKKRAQSARTHKARTTALRRRR
jgi:hypothetical protein